MKVTIKLIEKLIRSAKQWYKNHIWFQCQQEREGSDLETKVLYWASPNTEQNSQKETL